MPSTQILAMYDFGTATDFGNVQILAQRQILASG
jgi:hypothetical protein